MHVDRWVFKYKVFKAIFREELFVRILPCLLVHIRDEIA